MSSAVPNVVRVLKKVSSRPSVTRKHKRHEERRHRVVAASQSLPRRPGSRQLLLEFEQARVRREHGLAMQLLHKVGAVFREVHDTGRDPLRVQTVTPQRVHAAASSSSAETPSLRRACAGRLAEIRSQCRSTTTAGNGSWPAEQAVERIAHRRHLGGVEGRFAVYRRVTGCQQQAVSLPERDLEVLGEVDHQLAAGTGSPGLDEAQVPRRNVGLDREIELAQAAALPPVAEKVADCGGWRVQCSYLRFYTCPAASHLPRR